MRVLDLAKPIFPPGGRGGWHTVLPMLLLILGGGVHADSKEEGGLFDEVSEFARASLADHRQAGSIAGSLLGAALTSHPAGSIVGGIAGFFAGKLTMSTEDEQMEELAEDLGAVKADALPLLALSPAVSLSLAEQQAAALAVPLVSGLPRAGSDGRLVQLGAFEVETSAERALLLLRHQGLLAGGSAVSIFGQNNVRGDRVYRILMSPGPLTAAAACDTIKIRGGSCAVVVSENPGG